MDADYLRLYKIPLVAGQDFSHEKSASGREYIVNETLADELLKDEKDKSRDWLIGRHFGFDSAGVIVGIAQNFNFNSLHHKIETMFLFNVDGGFSNLSVKLKGGKAREAIAYIQSSWKRLFPENPLEYQFLDDRIGNFYKSERQLSDLYKIFAGIAIFLSCLGLYGLASFMAVQRLREIGIRKVLGASARSIVLLFSREFLILIAIAFGIASPLGIENGVGRRSGAGKNRGR